MLEWVRTSLKRRRSRFVCFVPRACDLVIDPILAALRISAFVTGVVLKSLLACLLAYSHACFGYEE